MVYLVPDTRYLVYVYTYDMVAACQPHQEATAVLDTAEPGRQTSQHDKEHKLHL